MAWSGVTTSEIVVWRRRRQLRAWHRAACCGLLPRCLAATPEVVPPYPHLTSSTTWTGALVSPFPSSKASAVARLQGARGRRPAFYVLDDDSVGLRPSLVSLQHRTSTVSPSDPLDLWGIHARATKNNGRVRKCNPAARSWCSSRAEGGHRHLRPSSEAT